MTRWKNKSYYGGQRGDGHYQMLINCVPRSDVYVECFCGLSAIFSYIRKDKTSKYFAIDINPEIIALHGEHSRENEIYINADYTAAAAIVAMYPVSSIFLHFDPPYRKTRSPKQYKHDIKTDKEFTRLLEFIVSHSERCKIAVSHPKYELFDKHLLSKGFVHHYFETNTRNGLIPNGLYVNYDLVNTQMADYQFAGTDFTDRQRIKRKIERFMNKINALPIDEKRSLIEKLILHNEY